jgi:flagellar basal body-associated protein FliL
MKIAAVLAVAAVAANIVFIWYSKKSNKAKTEESSNPKNGSSAFSEGYLNTPEARQLRKSAAAELGLSIEELDRMLAKEVKQLAKERELINIE